MIGLGQRLIHARMLKKATLEQAALDLRIRKEFLQALENGEYEKLPSSAYAVGFVGNYAAYLGMSRSETVAMFRREFDEKKVFRVLPEGFTKQKEFKIHRFRFHQIGFVFFLLICVVGYILYQYRFAFFPPFLEVSTPKDNVSIHSNEIVVTGKSDPSATVSINTNPVSLGGDGSFTKQLELFEGETIVRVEAINRFGKKSTIQRRVTVTLPSE